MAVDVALNIQSPKVLNAGDLFNQLLPIETVTLPTTGSQSTNSTTKNKAYNTYTPNFAFKEDFKDFHLQKPLDPQQLERNCFFPIDGYPYLSQNSTGLAFYANVLSPLRNIFNYEFDVVPQMEINGSQADHTLLNKEGKIFVVVGMKPYHSFLEEKLDDADQLIEKLQRSLHLSGEAGNKVMDESFFKQNPGEPVEAWQTRVGFKVHRDEDYQVLLPEAKTHKKPEETISQYRFRHAVKQLSCCLFELKRKVAFGILSSYCHTYFLILEHGSNGTSATLKISPVVNFCENDIFKKIAEFIVLAYATPLEDINIIVDVIPRDSEDSAGGRKNGNRGQREEENKGSTTKNKKADGSNHNRPQGDFQFSLGDVLGTGRHGVVFEIIDSKGKSFAAKRVAIESSEEIIHELEQEMKVYKKLRSLQGTIVPRLHYIGYFNQCLLTLVMDELKADPVWKCNPSDEQKEAIVAALQQIHGMGILHGDIRSSNILLDRSNQKQVYFIDFAFSTECSSDEAFRMEINELKTLLSMD